MSQPISVDILSDGDDEAEASECLHNKWDVHSNRTKKQRIEFDDNPTVLIIDDDPTPRKPYRREFSKCLRSSSPDPKPSRASGVNGLICLDSDDESENGDEFEGRNSKVLTATTMNQVPDGSMSGSAYMESANLLQMPEEGYECMNSMYYSATHLDPHGWRSSEIDESEPMDGVSGHKDQFEVEKKKETTMGGENMKKKMSKEERALLKQEKQQQKELERLQKAARKAEEVEMRKLNKEKLKWEKGKFALKSIVAQIDNKVVEMGSVGGHLLTRLADKGISYRITSNQIERSIVWTLNVPEEISQLASAGTEISYVLLVYEADNFCKLAMDELLFDHVNRVRQSYPHHTICYLTNKLMAFLNRREQVQYKNPKNHTSWKRPPVEEVLSKLTSHFFNVHSRHCIDEAELAEHVVGLTCSLASCQFRKKLTRLSVNANGAIIPKDSTEKNLIKNNLWLKALVAIPKVQPRFAIAIWKRYPTMKSLLRVYMDPNKQVHEKEFLLKDLITEGLLGDDRRLGEVCSKRVYRILMAQSGSIKTDEVEDGADFFSRPSSRVT